MNEIAVFNKSDLALIRKTVAKDCLPHEFDQFIHIAKAVGLDPLRRQIYAFVFGKGKDDEARNLTVVTAIDGYRAISARSGDYRPADQPTQYETDPDLKSPTNPHGIIRAIVTLYKWSHGAWHPVVGEAFWDEYVPLVEDGVTWEDIPGQFHKDGKPKRRKIVSESTKLIIDPKKTGWSKGPRNQIAKCAEAQAHRKGWPNDFAGVYVQEEVDRLHTLDLTASEIADIAEQDDRITKIGGPNMIIVDWMDGKPLASVPAGQFFDKTMEFLLGCNGEPNTVRAFEERNRVALRMFWGTHPGDCLELKKELEKAQAPAASDPSDIPESLKVMA
jgi:phage recombination protein Bet